MMDIKVRSTVDVINKVRQLWKPETVAPTGKIAGVYVLFNGGIAYIGQSIDVHGRIRRSREEMADSSTLLHVGMQ
jgi:hypothetical protein